MILGSGCVLPPLNATGLEFSWRFVETNSVDDTEEEDNRWVRTCNGAGVSRMFFVISQPDLPNRTGTFDFACTAGFQSESSADTQNSSAYVELREGTYDIAVVARAVTGQDQPLEPRTVEVGDTSVTADTVLMNLPTTSWSFEVQGATECQEIAFSLLLADPAVNVADPPVNEEGEVSEALYRENLVSVEGLNLSGEVAPCSAELDGFDVVENVDVGTYWVEILVDDRRCRSEPFTISLDGGAITLDLETLACEPA